MNGLIMLLIIIIPAVFAVLAFLAPQKAKEPTAVVGTAANLIAVISVYGRELTFFKPWAGFGIDFSLRLYSFSGLILLCAAVFSFLTALYSAAFFKGKAEAGQYTAYFLLTVTLINGAVMANNLALLLFFWEGILATMFLMIMSGGKDAYKTSVKAVIIVGLTDLCMMLGIGLTGYLAKTLEMDKIHLPIASLGTAAFLLLVIGALGKAGAMPFHTWIPDAADNAPTPFMAFMPGAAEKLLGIYLLFRICADLYKFEPGSPMSLLLMTIGALTIIFAVMMALIQKDFKRLLAYHAVSQVGYMLLGIGTALPVGIIGGLYHMLNNAVYKSCLFYSAGAVERQAGTSDLKKLGGLRKKMPVTFICFIVAAASIAGFPLTNGFFSKEMIFDGALESGAVFYIIALVGAFFTAVSFLKLGHAVFFGKTDKNTEKVCEAPLPMLLPMIFLAVSCLALGFGSRFVTARLLGTALAGGAKTEGASPLLTVISVCVLALAVLDHYYGFRKTGNGLSAADHFHYAPVLHGIYGQAEKKRFDPYHLGGYVIRCYAAAALYINDAINRFYDKYLVSAVSALSKSIRKAHNGNQAVYISWVLLGIALVTAIFAVSV